MNRYTFILFALILATISSCTYTEKVRDGQTAIDVKQYAVALEFLQKEYDKSKSRVEKGRIAFKVGESYKNLNQSDLAIRWYKIAYDNQYGWESLREYAFALK
ncbi:MAG: hypothetical protein KI786_04240, partial [Mameliella sp.]|nr:hypothetical protein [Phaeodactylibacter sp.]